MRTINTDTITKTVKELFMQANYHIPCSILTILKKRIELEESPLGKVILQQIYDNDQLAMKDEVAICQDTGVAILFVEYGQEVQVLGGDFETAVNEGVRQAYTEGYLRKTVIYDPLFDRRNTKDNTPAIIHTKLVPGDQIRLQAVPRGFGAENMSRVQIFTPTQGLEAVKQFIIETVNLAGPNACPPVIVGVGIGGDLEYACQIAKQATFRGCGTHNSNLNYAELEDSLLEEINKLGIGPAGLGGRTTALAVNIEYYPTHIASIPVAVNLCCHAARHAEIIL